MTSLFDAPDVLTNTGSDLEGRRALLKVFSSAIAGADAYAAVRSAVNKEGNDLRVGNLFTHASRVKEIAFVSVGIAAVPMASALVAALGDLVTQGLVICPEREATGLPFQVRQVVDTYLPSSAGAAAAEEALELASGLGKGDLFIPLISPGALGMLATPPPKMARESFLHIFEQVRSTIQREGALNEVMAALSRSQGGRLAQATRGAKTEALVVHNGGAALTGGGPATRLTAEVWERARECLDEAGIRPNPLHSLPGTPPSGPDDKTAPSQTRVVAVAGPIEALESAGDEAGHAKHTPRLLWVHRDGPPEALAAQFVQEAEAAFRRPYPANFRGQAAFAGLSLGTAEGMESTDLLARFLQAGRQELHRRDVTLGALYTGGSRPPHVNGCVGLTDVTSEPVMTGMKGGFTDVGVVAVAWRTAQRGRSLR